jgi:hypothetical protein
MQPEAPPPPKRRLNGGEEGTMTTLEVGAVAKRSKRRKAKRNEKWQNYEKK